jgi:YceI-like domain
MKKKILLILLLFALPSLARADSKWVLDHSFLTYHVSHPLHEVDGTSHAARGKGVCHAGECDFLIAATVKSFDSGDTNRDLHMIEITRGAAFPLVVVHTRVPDVDIKTSTIRADLEVKFAGQTARYKQVPFQLTMQGNEVRLTGTIPATLTDFKIKAPELLAMPIKNEIPVHVDMTWRRM